MSGALPPKHPLKAFCPSGSPVSVVPQTLHSGIGFRAHSLFAGCVPWRTVVRGISILEPSANSSHWVSPAKVSTFLWKHSSDTISLPSFLHSLPSQQHSPRSCTPQCTNTPVRVPSTMVDRHAPGRLSRLATMPHSRGLGREGEAILPLPNARRPRRVPYSAVNVGHWTPGRHTAPGSFHIRSAWSTPGDMVKVPQKTEDTHHGFERNTSCWPVTPMSTVRCFMGSVGRAGICVFVVNHKCEGAS